MALAIWGLKPRLMAGAYSLTRNSNQDELEDLFMRTVIRTMEYAHTYQEGTNLHAWALTILRNMWLSDKRKEWRLLFYDPNPDPTEDSPAITYDRAGVDDPSMRQQLLDVFAQMHEIPQLMVDAMVWLALGYTYEEAAVKEQVLVGTIKSRVARGRKMLRKLLKEPPSKNEGTWHESRKSFN